jgi:NADH-quinone oxidoreductase subunit H
LGILFIFAISSLSVYAFVIAGWSSNSRYAFLGGLRSSAQMISYEVSIGLILLNVLLCAGSLNLTEIVLFQENIWFIIPFFPIFAMFLISALAETSRSPFDLPEAENELVAGYFVEYSSIGFVLFFIAEYANIILMSSFTTILFLGGWLPLFAFLNWIPGIIWFILKLNVILFFFVWVRASLPRYRYDQLMQLGWKVFLPLSLGYVVFTSSFLVGMIL